MKRLFIDDYRSPKDCMYDPSKWDIVRNYEQAVKYIEEHKPQIISFDHDLSVEHYNGDFSKEKTGFDIAKKLVEMDMDGQDTITKDFKFFVHSMNPVGKKNIERYLARYFRLKYGYVGLKT